MSQRTETRLTMDREGLFDWLFSWGHVPVLFGLLAFMFWNRTRTYSRFITDSGIYLNGNDAWYHLRQVEYTVAHWPSTMPFDPWTHFPVGTASGQFGTLYDLLVATVALIVGLGSPDQETIMLTLLFAPAVFGVLTAIPVYYIARRLSGRLGGLTAVIVLALTAGGFLNRTLVGFADHHAPEAFFQVLAILALVVALDVATAEKPVFELIVGREWSALKRPAIASTLAGIAITLYVLVWPPGIVLGAILGTFFVVQLSIEFVRGRSPEHIGLIGVGSLLVAALLTLVSASTYSMSATSLSLLQPLLLGSVAAGIVVMLALARWFERAALPTVAYPILVAALIVTTVGGFSVLAPELYSYMVSQSMRFIGLATNAAQRTVTEAQPLVLNDTTSDNYWKTVLEKNYGYAFYVAVATVILILIQTILDDESRPGRLLIAIWGIFLTLAVFTQIRFTYYLALPVAVLTGYLVGWATSLLDVDAISSVTELETHQIVTLVTVLFLVVVPYPIVAHSFTSQGPTGGGSFAPLAVSNAEYNQPGSDVIAWNGSLSWMQSNTPREGQYATPDGEPMQYQKEYAPTDDFEYPEGAYGVMAWWDYGHWITTLGHRIPVANPFQQGAQEAADFLLATNEQDATDLLTGEESTRYVMVDWQIVSVNSKYHAPAQFESNETVTPTDLKFNLYQTVGNSGFRHVANIPTDRHMESMRTRLYRYNGSAVEPRPIVLDWETQQARLRTGGTQMIRVLPQNGSAIRQFDTLAAARTYVENDETSRLGVQRPSERLDAIEGYRMVHASKAVSSSGNQPWLKTFERVPGATVTGTATPNTEVKANVTLEMGSSGETFTYTQYANTSDDGTFEMRLPYSTTGYDNWGPEQGYTNTSVRATGPYTISTTDGSNASSTATVTEAQVIGEDNSTVQVEL
ncbi:oligosaccharyl transferase, archaeosortase A system-associated [Halocatena halophila]|uniref:oligosaccharyl transferase, archaeosortase A system-associated n=1 Tax=Halocatena halophila TaxID=2814576 RepID=UPI002ED0B429